MILDSSSALVVGSSVVGLTVFLALSGMAVYRRLLRPYLPLSEEMNNDVIFFASAINAFYGLTVGLIAVGVWRNYNAVQDIISQEAANIAALYRDISFYPEPLRGSLQEGLRDHTKFIIERAWPTQQQRVLINEGTVKLTNFQTELYSFEPQTAREQLIHAEALRQFNLIASLRRQRIEAVTGGLPSVMWAIVLIGAVLSLSVTYMVEVAPRAHYLLLSLLSTFTGLVIFVIWGLDHPLSGPVAIDPTAYELVLERLIDLH